jgi:hypothetical protein
MQSHCRAYSRVFRFRGKDPRPDSGSRCKPEKRLQPLKVSIKVTYRI